MFAIRCDNNQIVELTKTYHEELDLNNPFEFLSTVVTCVCLRAPQRKSLQINKVLKTSRARAMKLNNMWTNFASPKSKQIQLNNGDVETLAGVSHHDAALFLPRHRKFSRLNALSRFWAQSIILIYLHSLRQEYRLSILELMISQQR